MDDLLCEFANVVCNQNTPSWLSYIEVFIPILISVVVLIVTVCQHQQNKNVRNILYEKEKTFQMHTEVLKIYTAYEDLYDFLTLHNDLIQIFSVDKNLSNYYEKLREIGLSINHANDHAKLIFTDKEIVTVLENVRKHLASYIKAFVIFSLSEKRAESQEKAWKYVNQNYTIKKEDYWGLRKNNQAWRDFSKLWKDEDFLELEKMLKNMDSLFSDEAFDKYFAPYLKIEAPGDSASCKSSSQKKS